MDGGIIRFYNHPLLIPEQTEGLMIATDGSIHWRLTAGGFYKWVLNSEYIDLGEGTWDFDLTFQKIDTREVSLLKKRPSIEKR